VPSAVVVGGGISGIACARALADRGADVEVRDRASRLGGRMASRPLRDTGTAWDGHIVDLGASYLTVSDADFEAFIAGLGPVVRPWTSGFHVAGPDGILGVSGGPLRYAAPGGLRTVVEAAAAGLTVRHATTVREVEWRTTPTVDGEPVDAVALCLPLPQAARLAAALPPSPITWEPVIAVVAVFAERCWPELDGVFVNEDDVLTWIGDDGARRGDGAPVLVAHVHPVLSARHLGDPAAVIPPAVAALTRVLALSDLPDWCEVKRWSYARPLATERGDFHLDPRCAVGVAGDAFAGGPRVEAAWLSGHRLGHALADRLDDA
jgi:predicted NAD/FAD-dependent oxidoreductase